MGFTLADLSSEVALSSVRLPRLGPANAGPLYFGGWDLAILGGYKMPGKSRVLSGKIRLKHDPKRKPGADGSNPTFHGINPQEFGLEVEITTDAQLDNLVHFVCPGLLPSPWSKPPASSRQPWPPPVMFFHPSLANLSTVAGFPVVILGGTPLKFVRDNVLAMTFELLHWLPAPATKPAQVGTPLRQVQNKRAAAAAAAANPAPQSRPGFGGTPNFTPGP